MSEEAFRYSDQQWQAVMAAAEPHGALLDREEFEVLAAALIGSDAQIRGREAHREREARIAILAAAHMVTGNAVTREHLARELAQLKRIASSFADIAPARQRNVAREFLVSEALAAWFSIGHGKPGHTNPEGGEPGGPAVRFVQALFDPVFGPVEGPSGGRLKGSTVAATIDKMVAANLFRPKPEGAFRPRITTEWPPKGLSKRGVKSTA